ncbi:MAG: M48 family metallopeptidase [Planctomycetota bacterium]
MLAFCLVLLMGAVGAAFGAYFGSWMTGVLIGTGFAIVQYSVARSTGNSMVLAVAGAKAIESKQEDPQLVNIVEEVAIAAGIPCPTIYVIEDESPNAFATGFTPAKSAVAVTTGLRFKCSRDELQAIIAHEIGHIRNGDTGYMVLMAILVGSIAMLTDMALRGMFYSRGRSGRRGKGHGAIAVVALVLAILAPIVSRILQAAVSRQREYLADATSVELTRHPDSLVAALEKLTNDPIPLQAANRATQHLYVVNPMRRAKGGGGVLSTHPPLRDRIRRIQELTIGPPSG